MTCYQDLKELKEKVKILGWPITLYRDEHGVFDQVHIDGIGLRDPLSAAEFLRRIVAERMTRTEYMTRYPNAGRRRG